MFDRIAEGKWWDRALTLTRGCTPVSPGCLHCWSAADSHRKGSNPAVAAQYGMTVKHGISAGHWTGHAEPLPQNLEKPLHVRKPQAWAVWNDLMHEDISDDFIDRAFAVMALCQQHRFIILTKRELRMQESILRIGENISGIDGPGREMGRAVTWNRRGLVPWPLPNVWLGVSAENQEQADKRLPVLLSIPAAMRFVSIEPMLGPLNLERRQPGGDPCGPLNGGCCSRLDLVICGAETGPGKRLMNLDDARSLRDQCATSGTPFFFKRDSAGSHLLDGRTHEEVPE